MPWRRPAASYPAWWRFHLRPGVIASETRRVLGHLRPAAQERRLQLVTLPPSGPRRGTALVSYLVEPFLWPTDRPLPHSHTHYWEAREIALAFRDLGFETDVIDWTNNRFEPQRPYDVVLDVRTNLERLSSLVGERTLLIQHMETAHHSFHNSAQLARLEALERRRGVRLRPRRLIEENRAIDVAHFGTTVGNEFTVSTYEHAGRPIYRLRISTPVLFPEPVGKHWAECRRRWIWFGSGGLVHKGLDLVLEAFAELPDHQLTVCGPVHVERDFTAAFGRELFGLPNIHLEGWVDIASPRFRDLAARACGVVYPSCSEGGGGGIVTCLHAGLVPLVTRESSVDLDGFGFLLEEASVDAIRLQVRRISALPESELERLARAAWSHARRNHTREQFGEDLRRALADILARWQGGAAS